MFLVVDNERKIQLDWVNAILSKRNWRAHRLAVEAGMDPSALNRFLNDKTGRRTLNSYSIEKIETASGFPAFETEPKFATPLRGGLTEGDGSPYQHQGDGDIERAIEAIKGGRNGIDAWVLQTRCLETAGYLPGDVLMIDLNASPRHGDVVVAQVYDNAGRVETVIRFLGDVFLYGASNDASFREPILLGKNVVLRGRVLTQLRQQQAA